MKKIISIGMSLIPSMAIAHPGHLNQWIHGELLYLLLGVLVVLALVGALKITGKVFKRIIF